MATCIVCGCETPNKIACSRHSRVNSAWKSYNCILLNRGLPPLTFDQYQARRQVHQSTKRRLRLFRDEDMIGPSHKWDGKDRSPCSNCIHQGKDKGRYGCVKCAERSAYEESISHGVCYVKSHYSHIHLNAVEFSR